MTIRAQTFMPHVRSHPLVPPFLASFSTLLVVAAILVVHAAGVARAAPPKTPAVTNETLPRPTADMREAILTAVRSGKLADLKTAIELNEMRPDIADVAVADVVAYFKSLSKDGEGRDILAVLGKILAAKPATVPLGRDIENNAIYVWPYFAERDLAGLTADEQAELAALVPAEELADIKAAKHWAWWRLSIGADGTWHAFRKEK